MKIRSLFAGFLLSSLLLAAADVPRRASEFAIQLPQGGQKLLSDYRGKVVCLEFLYTTCPHCQQASQLMSRLQAEYGPKGFQSLGVAFNDMSKMLVPDFVRDFRVSYPVGYSTREAVHAFLQSNPDHALHVPQIVFIDKQGMIRQQSLPRGDGTTATEANMRNMIETLLKEPGSSSRKSGTRAGGKKAAS